MISEQHIVFHNKSGVKCVMIYASIKNKNDIIQGQEGKNKKDKTKLSKQKLIITWLALHVYIIMCLKCSVICEFDHPRNMG